MVRGVTAPLKMMDQEEASDADTTIALLQKVRGRLADVIAAADEPVVGQGHEQTAAEANGGGHQYRHAACRDRHSHWKQEILHAAFPETKRPRTGHAGPGAGSSGVTAAAKQAGRPYSKSGSLPS